MIKRVPTHFLKLSARKTMACLVICCLVTGLFAGLLTGCQGNTKTGTQASDQGTSQKTKKAQGEGDANTSSTSVEEKAGKKLSLVTSLFPAYDLARAIGGDRVDVDLLLKPGTDAHSFEPSPEDIKKIARADLFLRVGSEDEVWVDQVLKNLAEDQGQKVRTFALMDQVDLLAAHDLSGSVFAAAHDHDDDDHDEDRDHDHDHDEDHDHDHDHDEDHDHNHDDDDDHDHDHDHDDDHDHHHHHEDEKDEHVWTSLENMEDILEALTKVMIELSPEDRAYFEKNAKAYEKEMDELEEAYDKALTSKDLERKVLIFADRFPLRYLVRDYDLKFGAAYDGCAHEKAVSAKRVAALIDYVKDNKIPFVFTLEGSDQKIAKTIADATGAQILTYHSGHQVTADELTKGVTYLDMMRENLPLLEKALGKAN